MTLIVNLYGGPGIGKSTTAALIFGLLKKEKINVELVTEYAKDRVWDEHFSIFSNQIYVFAKQYHRIHRLLNKVDVVVTDAPLLLSLYYGQNLPNSFEQLILDTNKGLNNYNFFLQRNHPYNPIGRMQTEDEAELIDGKLKTLLIKNKIVFDEELTEDATPERIKRKVLAKLA